MMNFCLAWVEVLLLAFRLIVGCVLFLELVDSSRIERVLCV